MPTTTYAAWDPAFLFHHSAIDRLFVMRRELEEEFRVSDWTSSRVAGQYVSVRDKKTRPKNGSSQWIHIWSGARTVTWWHFGTGESVQNSNPRAIWVESRKYNHSDRSCDLIWRRRLGYCSWRFIRCTLGAFFLSSIDSRNWSTPVDYPCCCAALAQCGARPSYYLILQRPYTRSPDRRAEL